MYKKISFGVLLLILSCLLAYSAVKPLVEIMSGLGTLQDGTRVRYSTIVDPPGIKGFSGGGFEISGQTFRRHLIDGQNGLCFGYELVIEPLEGGKFSISFGPLNMSSSRLSNVLGYEVVNLPSPVFPPPQIIEDRDTIEFDVLVNRETQQKVIDRLTFTSSGSIF